jgi:hypothetical protein
VRRGAAALTVSCPASHILGVVYLADGELVLVSRSSRTFLGKLSVNIDGQLKPIEEALPAWKTKQSLEIIDFLQAHDEEWIKTGSTLPNPAPHPVQCDCTAITIPRDWVRERLYPGSPPNVAFEVVA